jgi:hypothetical protein
MSRACQHDCATREIATLALLAPPDQANPSTGGKVRLVGGCR